MCVEARVRVTTATIVSVPQVTLHDDRFRPASLSHALFDSSRLGRRGFHPPLMIFPESPSLSHPGGMAIFPTPATRRKLVLHLAETHVVARATILRGLPPLLTKNIYRETHPRKTHRISIRIVPFSPRLAERTIRSSFNFSLPGVEATQFHNSALLAPFRRLAARTAVMVFRII